jgi:hypothetical protein
MLFATSLTVAATTETFAALHLLWMFPASWLAGLLSALIFPFNLLSIPGWAFGELCCLGLDKEMVRRRSEIHQRYQELRVLRGLDHEEAQQFLATEYPNEVPTVTLSETNAECEINPAPSQRAHHEVVVDVMRHAMWAHGNPSNQHNTSYAALDDIANTRSHSERPISSISHNRIESSSCIPFEDHRSVQRAVLDAIRHSLWINGEPATRALNLATGLIMDLTGGELERSTVVSSLAYPPSSGPEHGGLCRMSADQRSKLAAAATYITSIGDAEPRVRDAELDWIRDNIELVELAATTSPEAV